jgi:hypothetical protein
VNANDRAWLSLEGLSVGDAFGERYFRPTPEALRRIEERQLSAAPWPYTYDTEMALSIVEVLWECGETPKPWRQAREALPLSAP